MFTVQYSLLCNKVSLVGRFVLSLVCGNVLFPDFVQCYLIVEFEALNIYTKQCVVVLLIAINKIGFGFNNNNPILDTRISFSFSSLPSVTLRLPPLISEMGWTGELWSNPVLLILEN